jgi:ribosomal protein S27AE
MELKDIRTLCPRCAAEYITASYKLKRDYSVIMRDNCDKCGRMGFQYEVIECQVKRCASASITDAET